MSIVEESEISSGDYSRTLSLDCTAEAAMDAIADGVSFWWSDIVAGNGAQGQTLAVIFGTTAKLLKVTERKGNERLVWECLDVLMPDPASDYPSEWRGTRMIWAIEPDGTGAKVTLTHEGLTPKLHCFETCQSAWDFFFLDSLKAYLQTGKGEPHINIK